MTYSVPPAGTNPAANADWPSASQPPSRCPGDIPREDLPRPLPPSSRPSETGYLRLRIIATGPPPAVQSHIRAMHHLGYAHPWQWSAPVPTADPGEVMSVLTKPVRAPE